MIKNIIFDFAGVIVDLNEDELIEKLGFDKKTANALTHICFKTDLFKGYQRGEISKDEFSLYLKYKFANYTQEIDEVLNANLRNAISVNDPIINLAKKLKDYGFRLFIMSNSTPETAEIIKNSDYSHLFENFVLSNETHYLKPTKAAYLNACEILDISADETLFIDDNPENIQAAEKCKFDTILCKSPAKTADSVEKILLGKVFE